MNTYNSIIYYELLWNMPFCVMSTFTFSVCYGIFWGQDFYTFTWVNVIAAFILRSLLSWNELSKFMPPRGWILSVVMAL